MTYLKPLDGLRGIAILLVCLYHWKLPGFVGGYFGVDIFFVLSGFLITSILLKEYGESGGISFKAFYFRRLCRLFPALCFLLLVHALLAVFTVHPGRHYISIAIVFFYLSNWSLALGLFDVGELGHTWSLSVEEQFYLLWPATMLALVKRLGTRVLAVCTLLLGLASTLERVLLYGGGATAARVYYALDTRFDALMYGCLVAVLLNGKRKKDGPGHVRHLVAAVAVAGLVWMVATCRETEPFRYFGGFFLVAVFSAVLVWTIATPGSEWIKKPLSNDLLVWFGKRSYGLYLWHDFISMILHTEKKGLGATVLAAALSLAMTEFSFRFVERPVLALKGKFAKKEAKALPLEAETVPGVS